MFADSEGRDGAEAVIEMEAFEVSESAFASLVPEDLAAQVRTIAADELAKSGALSLAEALQTRAGIHFRSWTGSPAQAEISLRGFGENSGLRVLVLIDGQRLNRPDLRGVNWLQVPVSAVERVEVVRGAATTLYGNHAVAGVINIITKRGDGGVSFEGGVAGGSYDLYDTDVAVSGSLGRASGFATVHHQEAEGYRQNSAYHATTFFGSGTMALTPLWETRATVIAQDGATEFPGILSAPTYERDRRFSTVTAAVETFPDSESSYNEGKTQILDLFNQHRMSPFAGGELLLDLGLRTRRTENRLSGSAVDDDAQSSLARVHWSFETEQTSGIFGYEWTRDDLDVVRLSLELGAPIGWAYLDRTITSGFAFLTHEVTDGLTVSGGFRFERTQLTYEQFLFGSPFLPSANDPLNQFENAERQRDGWSAELGLTRQIGSQAEWYTRVDRFFRYPVTDEIAAYQGFALDLGFNSGLEPEEGYAVESGFVVETAEGLIGVTVFGKWMEGEIIYDERERLNVNMPQTERWGVEVQAERNWDALSLGFYYTWQQARVTSSIPFLVSTDEVNRDFTDTGNFGRTIREPIVADGKDVPLVPEQVLSAYGEFRWRGLSVRATVSYTGEQWAGNDWFNQVPMPTYTVVDLHVRYRVNEYIDVYGVIANLNDRRYGSVYYATGDLRAPAVGAYSSPTLTGRGGVRIRF